MSKRSVVEWLGDIISWGERLEGHIAGMSFDDFLKDAKTQDAASKCAESIGLAANELSKLDPSLDREFPGLNLSSCLQIPEQAQSRLLRGRAGNRLEHRNRVHPADSCGSQAGQTQA